MEPIKISILQNERGGGTIKIKGAGINVFYKADYVMMHTIKSTPDSPTEAKITAIEIRNFKLAEEKNNQ
jgi:hypothetical protein